MCYNPHLRNIANSVHSYEQIIDPYIDPLLHSGTFGDTRNDQIQKLAGEPGLYQITAIQNTCIRKFKRISKR